MDGMDTLIYIIYVEIFWLKGQQNAVVTLLYYHATCEIKFWVQQTPTRNKLGAPAVFFSIHSLAHTHIRMDTHTLQISCEFILDFHLVLSQSQCNRHTFCCKASTDSRMILNTFFCCKASITGRMIWNTSFCHKPAQQAHPSVAKPVQQAADWFEIHPFVTNQHNRHILLLQSQLSQQRTDLKYILLSKNSATGTSFCCKASATGRMILKTSFCCEASATGSRMILNTSFCCKASTTGSRMIFNRLNWLYGWSSSSQKWTINKTALLIPYNCSTNYSLLLIIIKHW